MKKSKNLSASLTSGETLWGFFWMVFQFMFLPSLLAYGNSLLKRPFSGAELNFCYYFLNFLAVFCIFSSFLKKSALQVKKHPAYFLQAIILGFVAYYACSWVVGWFIGLIRPGFANLNDSAIAKLSSGSYFLMAIGTVLLVPPVEECLFRGLIFRNLYEKSHWAAYLISIIAFAAIHLMNYLTVYSPLGLILAFLQYVPAGLCLAWSYAKADTIFAPIVIHAIVNAMGISTMR
jgi:membrane protease YdiL (CAAX protease family)